MPAMVWRTSSRSNPWAGGDPECVQLARGRGAVWVRDSKDPDGPVLRFSPQQFRRAVAALKSEGMDGEG